jgi:hypothetical protein
MMSNVVETVHGLSGTANLWTNWIQIGFAGGCLILLVFVGWLIRALIRQTKQSADCNTCLATALQENTDVTRGLATAIQSLADHLGKPVTIPPPVIRRPRPFAPAPQAT